MEELPPLGPVASSQTAPPSTFTSLEGNSLDSAISVAPLSVASATLRPLPPIVRVIAPPTHIISAVDSTIRIPSHGAAMKARRMWDSQAYLWPFEPPVVKKAASRFEERHSVLSSRAEESLHSLLESGGSNMERRRRFQADMWELRAQRFQVQPLRMRALVSPRHGPLGHSRLAGLRLIAPKGGPWQMPKKRLNGDTVEAFEDEPQPKPEWKLEASIWGPRVSSNDSGDFYDSDAIFTAAFEEDFRVSVADGRLMRVIVRAEKEAGDAGADETTDEDALKKVLDDNKKLIYRLFKYYAAVGTDVTANTTGAIGKAGYVLFLETCHLVQTDNEHCERANLDAIFKSVDAALKLGGEEAEDDVFNDCNSVNRQEWLRVIVRIAMVRYVLSGEIRQVAAAVQALIEQHFVPNIGSPSELGPAHDANAFRQTFCYTEAVTEALEDNDGLLRTIYKHLSALKQIDETDDNLASSKLLSLSQWLAVCEPLVSDTAFGRVQAAYCFQYSRMFVVDESSRRGARRMRHLSFEDFLEAVVRLAQLLPLPTDDEIAAEGCDGAADFLARLGAGDRREVFDRAHADNLAHHLQERCVAHVIDVLLDCIPQNIKMRAGM